MPIEMDDSRMPVRLGSPLRVPDYAYPNWGLEPGSYREESDGAYSTEWEGGSPRQMEYVIEALKAAGMANFSQMLRDKTAEFVRDYIAGRRKKIKLLDVGAGVSTVDIWDAIDDDDKNRVTIYMLEPSEERVESAAQKLVGKGMKRKGRGKNLVVNVGRDMDIPDLFKPRTFDVITGVAVFHHHAYMDEPVKRMGEALKKGGYFVSADWHNSMWEQPSRVYSFLVGLDPEEFDWPTKEEDLEAFRHAYPLTETNEWAGSIRYAVANGQIGKFWEGWAKARQAAIQRGEFDEKDDILMLEGHRPRMHYIEYMRGAGIELADVMPLLPNSELLLFMTGMKL